MRGLPEAKLFSTDLIDDMHAAFEAVCSKLGLAPTSDKATALVVAKIVEVAKEGQKGAELTDEVLRFFGSSAPAGSRGPFASDAEPSTHSHATP
jgi:hypothetical protein